MFLWNFFQQLVITKQTWHHLRSSRVVCLLLIALLIYFIVNKKTSEENIQWVKHQAFFIKRNLTILISAHNSHNGLNFLFIITSLSMVKNLSSIPHCTADVRQLFLWNLFSWAPSLSNAPCLPILNWSHFLSISVQAMDDFWFPIV